MSRSLEIYKCATCGNVVEILHPGPGGLTCCGASMLLMVENTVDASKEKHLPVIEKGNGVINVKVGSIAHPMEPGHFIEWIELVADGKAYRQFLKPGDTPEATFAVTAEHVTAREFCNLHGQWSAVS